MAISLSGSAVSFSLTAWEKITHRNTQKWGPDLLLKHTRLQQLYFLIENTVTTEAASVNVFMSYCMWLIEALSITSSTWIDIISGESYKISCSSGIEKINMTTESAENKNISIYYLGFRLNKKWQRKRHKNYKLDILLLFIILFFIKKIKISLSVCLLKKYKKGVFLCCHWFFWFMSIKVILIVTHIPYLSGSQGRGR